MQCQWCAPRPRPRQFQGRPTPIHTHTAFFMRLPPTAVGSMCLLLLVPNPNEGAVFLLLSTCRPLPPIAEALPTGRNSALCVVVLGPLALKARPIHSLGCERGALPNVARGEVGRRESELRAPTEHSKEIKPTVAVVGSA